MFPLPDRVVHADWSKHPSKRWLARAGRTASGRWLLAQPEPVGDPGTLVFRHTEGVGTGRSVLLGFDFPIGLPEAYAGLAGIDSFREVLGELGRGRWLRFFDVASRLDEVGVERPFYPQGRADAGERPKAAFHSRLGVAPGVSLLRRCDRPYGQRGAACELFWTKGGNQVGKAAIAGWRQAADARGRTGKRVREDRRANAPAFGRWAERCGVELSAELAGEIEDGFGARVDGEDRFDAVVGLIGMLDTLLDPEGVPEPSAEAVVRIEGWIFGQPVP